MRSFLYFPKSFLLLSLALPLLLSSAAWGKANLSPHTVLQTPHSTSGYVRNPIDDDVKRATTFERAPVYHVNDIEDWKAERPALADKGDLYRDIFVGEDRTRGAGEEDFEDRDPELLRTKREAEREHGLVVGGTEDHLGDDVNTWQDKV